MNLRKQPLRKSFERNGLRMFEHLVRVNEDRKPKQILYDFVE